MFKTKLTRQAHSPFYLACYLVPKHKTRDRLSYSNPHFKESLGMPQLLFKIYQVAKDIHQTIFCSLHLNKLINFCMTSKGPNKHKILQILTTTTRNTTGPSVKGNKHRREQHVHNQLHSLFLTVPFHNLTSLIKFPKLAGSPNYTKPVFERELTCT